MEAVVPFFNVYETDCHLTIDEMAIEPGERMDFSLKKWVGMATLKSHVGTAKKALVFLLSGVSTRWKQVVGVHLTSQQPAEAGNQENPTGKAMSEFIDEVVIRSEKTGLRVNGITTDMGADNLAWWKEKGINATRHGPVTCSFPHPARPDDQLYVLPDAPHLFKSIKAMLESNETVRLPPEILPNDEGLTTNVVSYSHIEELCKFENQFELKVAPRLKEEHVHCKGHFNKMNVSTSRAVINNRTGAGLKKLSDVKGDPSYRTTEWFVLLLNDFFKIVTSRNHKLALSLHDPVAHKKAMDTLDKVSYISRYMLVGEKGTWKPCQRGVLILVESIKGLQKYYLEVRKYQFLLLGHLTQDCLENLFSCLRLKQAVPHAIAFMHNLKVITLAMYNTFVRRSNYDHVESSFLVDPLAEAREKAAHRAADRAAKARTEQELNPVPIITREDLEEIDEWERSNIYHMAGSTLHSLQKTSNTLCSTCINAVLWKENYPHPYSDITRLTEYVLTGQKTDDKTAEAKENELGNNEERPIEKKWKQKKEIIKGGAEGDELHQIQVSHECFAVIFIAEVTFRKIRRQLPWFSNVDVLRYLTDGLMYVWEGSAVPECHDIKRKIVEDYLRKRLKRYGIDRSAELRRQRTIDRSSKSVAMRQVVKQVKSKSSDAPK